MWSIVGLVELNNVSLLEVAVMLDLWRSRKGAKATGGTIQPMAYRKCCAWINGPALSFQISMTQMDCAVFQPPNETFRRVRRMLNTGREPLYGMRVMTTASWKNRYVATA